MKAVLRIGRPTSLVLVASALVVGVAAAAAPRGHYALTPDSTTDVRTGLEWQRHPTKPLSFSDALLACNDLGAQWRMPSARELETLVDVRATMAPAWDVGAFGGAEPEPVFWTLTAVRSGEGRRVVDFRPARQIAALSETDLAYVRCARGPR